MQKDKIVEYAARGIVPDQEMTCPERALFYTLKDVYNDFRKGVLSKDRGETLKNRALRQFDLDQGAFDSALRILRDNAELWKRIETEGNHYRLDRTLENADMFVEAVYGVRMKQLKKFTEEQKQKEGDTSDE